MPPRVRRRVSGFCVAAAVAASARAVAADPAPPPSDEFLEYLGGWDGEDGDWLLVQEAVGAQSPRPVPPAPVTSGTRRPPADGGAKATQEQKK